MTKKSRYMIDWTIPAGRTDWFFGTGASGAERRLVYAASAIAVVAAALVALHQQVSWSWWQWLLVALLAADAAGGVVANSLGTAKRLYHSPLADGASGMSRLLHNHLAFSALHLHVFAVAAALPDATWRWALAWYVASLLSTAAVVTTPLYLRRPLGIAAFTLSLIAAPTVTAPDGLRWLGPVLLLKLAVAHALREEPYRPSPIPHPSATTRFVG